MRVSIDFGPARGWRSFSAVSYRCACAWLLGTILGTTRPAPVALAADPVKVDFNFQIRPLLSDRCFKCHGPDEKARKAKLRLDLREGILKELEDGWAVVKPGNPARSEMVRRIFATDEDDLMPPPKSNLKLAAAEKELLKNWIAQGAEIKPHWSLNPVPPVERPQPRNSASVKNPIDAFVVARLETESFQPAPQASRETLIRRLALDLTGLPPTVEEIEGFLADTSADTGLWRTHGDGLA